MSSLQQTSTDRRKILRHVIVFALGVISVLYLLNIGAGVFELIPDNIPFIGNLDEAAAMLLLVNCLAYFGYDLRRFFRRKPDAGRE